MRLNQEEQQLILDFYFRCATDEEVVRGRDLIASNSEAARLYDGFHEALTELDALKYEPCPDNLAELTLARLKLAASSNAIERTESPLMLQHLLEIERRKSEKTRLGLPETLPRTGLFLRRFYEIAAVAAAIILVAGVVFPVTSGMRHREQATLCTNSMRSVGQALSQFMGDNENLASVKLAAGSPWWRIGDQSQNAQSNTRLAWQLLKQNYAKPQDFICAGHKTGIPVTPELLQQLNDFPSRNHISYSFMIICDKTAPMQNRSKQIIMGDMNPIFRRIPKCGNTMYNILSEPEKVVLSEQLKKMSSPNHSGRGQNVLYSDGSVVFVKQRMVNDDDIFTLRGVNTYTGTETPADKNDIFLVP
jgi:hypothetical protein